LLEIHKNLPEGQASSPSLTAFNKSFGTSYRGELLSVGCEAVSIGDGASKILTLWKSPTLVDETGGVSEQTSRLPERPFGILERSLVVPRRELLQVRNRCSSLRMKKVRYFLRLFSLCIYQLSFYSFILWFSRIWISSSIVPCIRACRTTQGLCGKSLHI
jgi:hypothetical protein